MVDTYGKKCPNCGKGIEDFEDFCTVECGKENLGLKDNKIEDFCIVCLQPLTIEQKRKGVCAEHG